MRLLHDALPTDRLTVRPWPDPVIDVVGHDPRSAYVETFWLGVLGPSTTWFLRRVAAGLEAQPAGFDLPMGATAGALGLSGTGKNAPFTRTILRCCQFGMAQLQGTGELAVRRKLPPLNRRQLARLPEALQEQHRLWLEAELRTPGGERLERRARRLALSLLELGEELEETERQLLRWKFSPVLARHAALWAWDRHRKALAELDVTDEPVVPPDAA